MFLSKEKTNIKKLRSAVEFVVNANAPTRIINGTALCRQYVLSSFDKITSYDAVKKDCASFGDDFNYERKAYDLVFNICQNGIVSGSLNLMPGLLSPVGEAVFGLFENVINHYEKNGWMSKDESSNVYREARAAVVTY